MQTMTSMVAVMLLVVGGVYSAGLRADDSEAVFPGKAWAKKTPAEVGLDARKLKQFSQFVGGRGCVVRHGYLVYTWGDVFGSYSWLWWINGVDREGTRFWPDAPHDTYGAFGHGGPRAMWVIPSLDIGVSYNDTKLRGWYSGEKSPTNQAMKRLVATVGQ